MDRGEIVLAVGLHQVVAGEELVGGEDTVAVLARDAHEFREARAGPYEHSLEPFLVEKIVYGQGSAYDDIRLDLHAKLAHFLDFVRKHRVLWKAELGDAVNQHAADLVKGLEYGDVVAPFREVARAGKTCRAGAHYCHLFSLADLLHFRLWSHSVLAAPVGRKALQVADCDTLALDAEHAAAFALGFLRAHAAAHCRKGGIHGYYAGSAKHVPFLDFLYEFRYADANRAGCNAARILAVKAPCGLLLSLLKIESEADFIEIAGPHLRVLLPDLCSWCSYHCIASFAFVSSVLYCP